MLRYIFTLIALFMFAAPAMAQAEQPQFTKMSATPEFTTIEDGQTIFIAIEKELHPDWHTYWINAGDSGEAAIIKWNAPEGFIFKDITWPTPEVIPFGPLTNYGYHRDVTLLQEMQAPSPLPEGPLEFSANVELLVCEEICIPEYHTLKFTLNDGRDEDNSELVSAAMSDTPVIVRWPAIYSEDNVNNLFKITLDAQSLALLTDGNESFTADLLPYEWGLVENTAQTLMRLDQEPRRTLTIMKERGARDLDNLGALRFVFITNAEGKPARAIDFIATPDPNWLIEANSGNNQTGGAQNRLAALETTSLLTALLFALIGGVILNLMPCVFPVLSMKALKLTQLSGKSSGQAQLHGLAYTAGILVCFAIIAGILIALKSAGAQIGWGFHLQSPIIIVLLTYLIFMIGLNLSGFFEVNTRFAGLGGALSAKDGLGGSFFTGVLATLVATPCTAPFMGAAIGFALTQSPVFSMAIFLTLGLGLALPYLLLCFVPFLRTKMPKPGLWMVKFKELLAFPMYATAAWLLSVYSQQAGTLALLTALSVMVAIAFTIWILKIKPVNKGGRILLYGFTLLILASLIFANVKISLSSGDANNAQGTTASAHNHHTGNVDLRDFTPQALQEALATERPVFVNMTAAWCITCKVNEKIALQIDSTRAAFEENEMIYFKGDWTNKNEDISIYLESYGRNGVPLYTYYAPPQNGVRPQARVLPQILTPGMIKSLFNEE